MRKLAVPILLVLLAAACAKAPPVVVAPSSPLHPDFVFPVAPPGTPPPTLERLERGWRLLQSDDLAGADREFSALLRTNRDFTPAAAGQGYVALARQRPDDALAAFDRAVAADGAYPPALVGRGLAYLSSGREDQALASFEAALAVDPSLPEVASRVEVLRVRQAQDRVSRAEQAAAAGRFDEARDAYLAAMSASPDSPFLPRDLARSERRAGRLDSALEYAQKAVVLDPSDARSHQVEAEIRTEQGDLAGALAAYERVAALDPTPAVTTAIADLRERLRDLALPAQYRAIPESPSATRADLAALLGVRLAPVLASAPQRQIVVTDVRGHWARPWIEATARAGAMEVFSNYTFQPGTPLRRADVADVVNRMLALMRGGATARWDQAALQIADVPPGHLAYPAVRRAVGAGVMPLEDGAFRLLQPVSGADLAAIVARLEALGAAQ